MKDGVSCFSCSLLTDATQTAVSLPQTRPLVVFAASGLPRAANRTFFFSEASRTNKRESERQEQTSDFFFGGMVARVYQSPRRQRRRGALRQYE